MNDEENEGPETKAAPRGRPPAKHEPPPPFRDMSYQRGLGSAFVEPGQALSRMTILEAVAALLFEPQRFPKSSSILVDLEDSARWILREEQDEHGQPLERARKHRFDLRLKHLSAELFSDDVNVRDEAVRIFVSEASRMGWAVEPETVKARIVEVARPRAPDELTGDRDRSPPLIERLVAGLDGLPFGLWSEGTKNNRRKERIKGAKPTFGPGRAPELTSVIRAVAAGGWPNGEERSGGAAPDLDEALASIVAMSIRLGDGSLEEQDRVLFALDCACRTFETRASASGAYSFGPVLWPHEVERSAQLVVDLALALGSRDNWALWQCARGGRKIQRRVDGTWAEVVVPLAGAEQPRARSYTRFTIDEQDQPRDVALLLWQRVDARIAELGRSAVVALDSGETIEPSAPDAASNPYDPRVPMDLKNALPFWLAKPMHGPSKDEVPENERRALLRAVAVRFAEVHDRLEKRWNDGINRQSGPAE